MDRTNRDEVPFDAELVRREIEALIHCLTRKSPALEGALANDDRRNGEGNG